MTNEHFQRKIGKQKTHWWSALILVLFSCSIFFVAIEIILRIIGYGSPIERRDPFQGFEGTNRIFQETAIPGEGNIYVPSPNKSYIDQRFPTVKPEDVYRIFTFGGSTTGGIPWGREYSFSALMRESLRKRIPFKQIEVINVGVAGYASSRVLVILREMLDYEPDLLIVYTGQNEFRDAHFHKRELPRSAFWGNLLKLFYSSRVFFLISERSELLMQRISGKRIDSYASESIEAVVTKPFTKETFQSLDYYRRPDFTKNQVPEKSVDSDQKADEKISFASPKSLVKGILGKNGWQSLKYFLGLEELSEKEVYGIFEKNIRTMIDLSRNRGVPILFVAKAQNPKVMDLQNPYRIDPQIFIEDGKIEEWERFYSNGIQHMKGGNFQKALQAFHRVRDLYKPSFRTRDNFLALYIGECYEGLGDYVRANNEYDQRLHPNHKYLNALLKSVALESGVPILDAYEILVEKAEHGIVGYNFFVDAVHMTLAGYKVIGLALADYIGTQGFISKSNIQEGRDIQAYDISLGGVEHNLSEKDFPADVFTSLGWSAFNQGQYEKALFWGLRAVEKSPEDVQAHLLLGYIYAKQQKEDAATKEWEALKLLWGELEKH